MQQSHTLAGTRNVRSTATVYVITSQANLRDALTGGFIGPRNSFYRTYQPDFLELCPGRIPLFSGAVTSEMLYYVQRSDPDTTFPVLLELELSVGELRHVPRLEGGAGPDGPAWTCYAMGRSIGLDALRALHFLSEDQATEFRVRIFRDLPDFTHLMRTSPELVSTQGPSIREVTDWLRQLQDISAPDLASFAAHDRVAGAVMLALPFAPPSVHPSLTGLVDRVHGPLPGLLPWIVAGLYPENQPPDNERNENELLFAACVRVLHQVPPGISTGLALLDLIDAELKRGEVVSGPAADVLHRARRLLRNEEEFRVLRSSSFVVAAALLLFLIRPDGMRLLDWSPKETGATDEVMQTAMVFAGLLWGRRALDVRLRPADADGNVMRIAVGSLNREAAAAETALGNAGDDFNGQGGGTELSAAMVTGLPEQLPGEAVSAELHEPVLPAVTFSGRTPRAPKNGGRRKTIPAVQEPAEQTGMAPDELRGIMLGADYTDSAILGTAVDISIAMAWGSCVRSQVVVPMDSLSTLIPVKRGREKVLALSMAGIAKVEYELVVEEFRVLLENLRPNDRRWQKVAEGMDPVALRPAESAGAGSAGAESLEAGLTETNDVFLTAVRNAVFPDSASE
jgi:hypothetical protein